MNRYGRRIVVASSHLAAAVIFFGLIFSPEDAGVRTALWALGKFAISCSFMSIYVYASEIFPTNIRNLSIGFCEMMSRVGGILAPYVVVLVSLTLRQNTPLQKKNTCCYRISGPPCRFSTTLKIHDNIQNFG
ncbi:hypothetical protein Y032_0070g429 [Ancylostoma ceylanicum]|uniref:Major facilitator superfamily (MFS) profile domain-containing protein n=1 Tax=Ancylostoma ceylanicum TaxID=53326 RepID=A0A016TX96_9BILA|nr:hypothetical protein Y032_0070g429 [Ancylostoma ceylanicum]